MSRRSNEMDPDAPINVVIGTLATGEEQRSPRGSLYQPRIAPVINQISIRRFYLQYQALSQQLTPR